VLRRRTRTCLFSVAAAWAAIAVLAPAAAARRVVLVATKDTTLHGPFGPQLSNGAGPSVFAGSTRNFGVRRALLHFGTLADSIPDDATIDSVQVQLNLDRTSSGAFEFRLHRLLADWGEAGSNNPGGGGASAELGDATWTHAFWQTVQWTVAGGDFVATASAQTTVDQIGAYVWGPTPGLAADVQAWVDDPATNFGWILIGNEQEASAKRFDSHESTNTAGHPRLVIDFSPPTPVAPSTWSSVKQLFESRSRREVGR
jgi:hypothetical protein